jgi:WD40 repeat protein
VAVQTGYLIGSIEGRVAVQHIEESHHSKNFTFKCHREDQDIYAVNHLTFHPTLGTFVTCGSDGTFNFWCAPSSPLTRSQRLSFDSPAAVTRNPCVARTYRLLRVPRVLMYFVRRVSCITATDFDH